MSTEAQIRAWTRGCVLLGFHGPVLPSWLAAALRDGLAGVVLFASNLSSDPDAEQAATRVIDDLRAAAGGRQLVLAMDEEGGDVTRLDQAVGSRVPGAAALGALDDPLTTQEVYGAIGARLAGVGVTLNLAPVADVNSDPRNPVIGVRSFGANPDVVARHVAAAVRGLQRNGVAACAKHFPGHGATAQDSHHETARLHRSAAELRTVELPPFRAAVTAGVAAIMTGHLLVPAFDADAPTTVSRRLTTTLLRQELGFSGAVVTDALEMRALAGTIGMVEGLVATLAAGSDTAETGALDHPDFLAAAEDAVLAAVRTGRLTEERLAEAAARTASLARPGTPAPYDAGLVDAAAARSLEQSGAIALPAGPVLVVEFRSGNGMTSGTLPWSLADRLAERRPAVETVLVAGPADAAAVRERLQANCTDRGVVLVVRDPVQNPWQAEAVDGTTPSDHWRVVDVGWPGPLPPALADLPRLRTRGVAPGLLSAAADRLAGTDPAQAPVSTIGEQA